MSKGTRLSARGTTEGRKAHTDLSLCLTKEYTHNLTEEYTNKSIEKYSQVTLLAVVD
jgi:hypothetical protein